MDKKEAGAMNIKLLVIVYIILFLMIFLVNLLSYRHGLINSFLLSLAVVALSFTMLVIGNRLK